MRKSFIFYSLFFVFGVFSLEIKAEDDVYVRKQIQPDFFIPENALSQAEKLPVPRYYKGADTTIKQAKPEPARRIIKTTDDNIEHNIKPEYQQKYDDYSNDLEHISQTGRIPENKKLAKDLGYMSSDKRIVVKKKPYKTRNVERKFNKALEESLNNN